MSYTLKIFSTHLPFVAFSGTVSPHLESITLTCDPYWGPQLVDCLCYVADLCKMPSMRSLEINIATDDLVLDTFLVMLNHSLHCNPSFTNFPLWESYSPSPNFSSALRTHPSLLSWKRSKSLSDLSTIGQESSDATKSAFWNRDYYFSMGGKCLSCPDLLEMQSLHTMHPLLHKALHTDRLYC